MSCCAIITPIFEETGKQTVDKNHVFVYVYTFLYSHCCFPTRGESSPQDMLMVTNISSQFKTSEHHNRLLHLQPLSLKKKLQYVSINL